VDKIAGWARWVVVENGNGTEVELWIVRYGNGFQILRFTDNFIAQHPDLFQNAGH